MGDATSANPLAVVIIASVCSGLVVAVINQVVNFYRDHLSFRRQKLEELHRAVFRLTFALEKMLWPLITEFNRWKIRAEKEQKEDFSMTGTAAEYKEIVTAMIKKIRTEQTILDDLEVAIRMISIYFPKLKDERAALSGLAQNTLTLLDNPNLTSQLGLPGHQTMDMPRLCSHLAQEASNIGHRLVERIWGCAPPDITMGVSQNP